MVSPNSVVVVNGLNNINGRIAWETKRATSTPTVKTCVSGSVGILLISSSSFIRLMFRRSRGVK